MLLAIKEKTQGFAVAIILVLGAFMVVPLLYDYVSGLGDNSAVKVNDDKVTLQEFSQQLSVNRQRLAQAFGGNIPEYFNQDQFLNKQTIDYIVQDKLLNQATIEDGYRLSPSTVKQLITEVPDFQVDGQFDRETYTRQLQSIGRSEVGFELEFAKQLAHAQLQDGLVKSAFVLESDLENVAALQHQARDFSYLTLDSEKVRSAQEVTDEELEQYHSDNQSQFQHPEKASIEYVELDFEKYKEAVDVTEESLKAEYDAGVENGRYTTPEVRSASHILLKVAEDADEATIEAKRIEAVALVEKLKAGEDFAETAKTLSEDPGSAAQGGDLGEVRRGVMVPAFEDAVYAQAQGEIGEPVKTRFGFHIIRVDGVEAEVKKPYVEVQEEIRDEYVSNIAREKFDADLDEVSNMAFENPDSLDPIAETVGIEIKSTPLFTRSSGEGIAGNSDVRSAAFQPEVLLEGNNSGALEVDEKVIVLRIKEHQPATDKTLEESKSEVESILLTQKTNDTLTESVDAITAALADGGSIDDLAKEYSGNVTAVEGVTRTDRKGVDNQLVQEVFSVAYNADEVSVASSVIAGGNRAIAVLSAVNNGSLDGLDQAEKDRLAEQVKGAMGNGDVSSLLNTLRADADIYVNPQLQTAE